VRRGCPEITGLAVIALAVVGAAVTPARAATPTVTINWDGSQFTSTPTVASGTVVKWHNAGGQLDGSVTISYKSGPTTFKSVTVDKGRTSSGTTMTGGSKQEDEVVTGQESDAALNQNDKANGTIHVKAQPAPAPSPTHTTSRPSPKPTHPSVPEPTPTPSPSAPLTVTNPPPLGVGAAPTPTATPSGPNPLVALPPQPPPSPTLEPALTDAPRALAQAVPARKYGLPSVLAAVLLAGVGVGVVRARRSDNGQPPSH
jgi:hypothetical protein